MQPLISKSDPAPPPETVDQPASSEIGHAILSVLSDLENSLTASQRFLLARDLSGLERTCADQLRLVQTLQIFWPRSAAPQPGRNVPSSDDALDSALHAAQLRVLHLSRIQAALLARAQRGLKMIEHLSAGGGASYAPCLPLGSPPSANLVQSPNSSAIAQFEKGTPCQD